MNEEIEMLYNTIDAQDKIINEQLKEISRLKRLKEEGYYKTFSDLKNELGEDFEIFLYNSNIELLDKIDKAIEYIKHSQSYGTMAQVMSHLKPYVNGDELLEILGDKE